MFRDFEPGAAFHYLPSFRRIRVDFESHLSASNAKQHMDSTILGDNTIHCYFIQVNFLWTKLLKMTLCDRKGKVSLIQHTLILYSGFVTMHRWRGIFACSSIGEAISYIPSLQPSCWMGTTSGRQTSCWLWPSRSNGAIVTR